MRKRRSKKTIEQHEKNQSNWLYSLLNIAALLLKRCVHVFTCSEYNFIRCCIIYVVVTGIESSNTLVFKCIGKQCFRRKLRFVVVMTLNFFFFF